MTINKIRNEAKLILSLEGRLDTTTSPELEKEIKNSLDGIAELVFDLDKLEYISSSGLRVLLAAQKTMSKQGYMKIIHPSEIVLEIFDITGFSDILDIEK